MRDGVKKIWQWAKPKRFFVFFLCMELAVLCLGWKAFYTAPTQFSIGESAPYYDLTPFLPAQGWANQRQWFPAEGGFLNRIIFSVMTDGSGSGGFTVNVLDEAGDVLVSRHYAPEELTGEFQELNIQKTVEYGHRYCFEAVADEGGSAWSVPYLYVPGGELSWLEDGEVDGAPMEGGACYLFLSFYFARISYAAIALHAAALLAGAAYLIFSFPKKGAGKAHSADAAALCIACACAAGQFLLCKKLYLSRTLLLCLPCAFIAWYAAMRLGWWVWLKSSLKAWLRRAFLNEWLRAHLRLLLRSWKSAVFLIAALLLSTLFFICIREGVPSSLENYFYMALSALLIFLLLGIIPTPRLDRFCVRFPWTIYAANSILIFLQMEIADANPFQTIRFGLAIFNIVTIFVVFAVLWALLGNLRAAGIVGTVLFAVWGFANYLTVVFRGIPIAPSDLMSAGTALNVLGNYQIERNIQLLSFWTPIPLELLLVFRLPAKQPHSATAKKRLLQRGTTAFCAILFFWQGYFGALSPVSMHGWQWRWQEGDYPQGYVAVSIKKIQQLFLNAPAGYSPEKMQMLYEAQSGQAETALPDTEQRPNIILILNESWFDWRQVTEFETIRPVMPFLDSLENCIRGFAVGPQDRGGTSLSEYELLTSNSLSMLPGITPFTQRNLEGSYSVVSYLEALGYTTAAIHPANSENYNRSVVYPQLGFDRISFLNRDTRWREADALREYISDESAFRMAKLFFDEKETGAPALIYLLTIQNHGGYSMSEKNGGGYALADAFEMDLQKGFDLCKGEAEEYLSLVRYTDAAFEKLLGELENEPEPTLVCMVGDHAPGLWEVTSSYEGYEWSMRQRGTPFIIWANYPIESYNAGYIGMVQLMPLLMQTAELPLSPYYQAILDVSEKYPVLSAAFYRDANGNFGSYTYMQEPPQSELLKRYFYYEYNSLLSAKNRMEKVFLAG